MSAGVQHDDAKCAVCDGPLEQHRDAICETCVPESAWFAPAETCQKCGVELGDIDGMYYCKACECALTALEASDAGS